MEFVLTPGKLTLTDIINLLDESTTLTLDPKALPRIEQAATVVNKIITSGKTIYGINTGFGALAQTKILPEQLETLQKSLVLSHAAGCGKLLPDQIVRLILLLKINSLARGYSGVRLITLNYLIALFNAGIYPCIPEKGSVGASGDLAPLAHLSCVLIGEGHAHYHGKRLSAAEALAQLNLTPLQLAPKEGLALLNGTQVSTALALYALLGAENLLCHGILAGALSTDAIRGSDYPFQANIQAIRGHEGQIQVAAHLSQLLAQSAIRASHEECDKVQDPYSIRCQPQVMGACLSQWWHVRDTLLIEANAVSDNPLIFVENAEIISGGNFHAQPVAFAADNLALCISEIGALAERRIAVLVDPRFSHLPAFLVHQAGVNSGFMLAHVTAAALASENKSLAHPASVDSIPTSANQEDHVSMATFAARRLLTLIENVTVILGIEMIAACQGIDFLRPHTTSPLLEAIHRFIRQHVAFYAEDRYFAPDIATIQALIVQKQLIQFLPFSFLH